MVLDSSSSCWIRNYLEMEVLFSYNRPREHRSQRARGNPGIWCNGGTLVTEHLAVLLSKQLDFRVRRISWA